LFVIDKWVFFCFFEDLGSLLSDGLLPLGEFLIE
jgi:hypothetical protein